MRWRYEQLQNISRIQINQGRSDRKAMRIRRSASDAFRFSKANCRMGGSPRPCRDIRRLRTWENVNAARMGSHCRREMPDIHAARRFRSDD